MSGNSVLRKKMRSGGWLLLSCILWASLSGGASASLAEGSREEKPYEFFVFDNGLKNDKWSAQRQAKILKELGYDGISYRTTTASLAERQKVFNRHRLKIFALYAHCWPGKDNPYPKHFKTILPMIEGTDTMLWMTVNGNTDDEETVRVVREIADIADKHDVKIAFYPHYGDYIATARDALRIARKVERENIGVSINLCHELRSGNAAELGEIIAEAIPFLFLVSINGADRGGDGWNDLIQTLDKGTFDVRGFLEKLKRAGYEGPIGLQCFSIPGDPVANLKASMKAWQKFSEMKK